AKSQKRAFGYLDGPAAYFVQEPARVKIKYTVVHRRLTNHFAINNQVALLVNRHIFSLKPSDPLDEKGPLHSERGRRHLKDHDVAPLGQRREPIGKLVYQNAVKPYSQLVVNQPQLSLGNAIIAPHAGAAHSVWIKDIDA